MRILEAISLFPIKARNACHRFRREQILLYFYLTRRPIIFDLYVPKMGLFAHLSWIIAGLDWAERHNAIFYFMCTNSQYNFKNSREDWLSLVISQFPRPRARVFEISKYSEFPFSKDICHGTRAHSRALFSRHLKVNSKLESESKTWFCDVFSNRFVIGVHYRGSDKYIEADKLSFESVLTPIKRIIGILQSQGISNIGVFVATDDSCFLPFIKQQLKHVSVNAREQFCRSNNLLGVHNQGIEDGTVLAYEAMTDALLLSRTNLLVKTSSLLSGWAAILGQNMPILFLGSPYASSCYYPDSTLIHECFREGQEKDAVHAALELYPNTPNVV